MKAIIEIEFGYLTSSDDHVLESFIDAMSGTVYSDTFGKEIAEVKEVKGRVLPKTFEKTRHFW